MSRRALAPVEVETMKLGLKLSDAKRMFFDRPAVQALLTKDERARLSRFGAFVRTRAKTSIKTSRKNESSAPGETPKGHTGDLKKRIYFAFDPNRRSVVIGPTTFDRRTGEELAALETGGMTTITESASAGARRRRRVFIKARPFMLPAFNAELPTASVNWAKA